MSESIRRWLLREGEDPLDLSWRLLRLLNIYRGLVAALFLAIFLLGGDSPHLVGDARPQVFQWALQIYLSLFLIFAATLMARQPGFGIQVYLQLATDIAAVTLLVYSSGGIGSGHGILMTPPIIAAGLLLSRRAALATAAVAALAIIAQQVYAVWVGVSAQDHYTQTGVLGAVFFFAAVVGSAFAVRMRESEALAAQRGIDLADLAQLNEYIIEHMQNGVLVLDQDGDVRMLNAAASQFLGIPRGLEGQSLEEVAPTLHRQWSQWRQDPFARMETVDSASGESAIAPHFTRIRGVGGEATLIFLEDTRLATEQVQQMKLAALGRLVASIAHELRNPLGAISHAGELLSESRAEEPQDLRLTQIIRDHSSRMNTIVESILQLSRREWTTPDQLDAASWLADFVDEFRSVKGLGDDRLHLTLETDHMQVRIDPTHLHQVVTNLVENALKHSGSTEAVEVFAGHGPDGRLAIEVRDRGQGIADEAAERIFEPFYTGAESGTGLGLFISKELCECNRARLDYRPREGGGSIFRISFPDAQQWVQ